MICSEDVTLRAPQEGRTVTASRAEYDMEGRTVVFHGQPVTLVDEMGGKVQGRQLLYWLDDGRVTMQSEPSSPARPDGGAASADDHGTG
jgi:lipopolysaccharide export system protein LptA